PRLRRLTDVTRSVPRTCRRTRASTPPPSSRSSTRSRPTRPSSCTASWCCGTGTSWRRAGGRRKRPSGHACVLAEQELHLDGARPPPPRAPAALPRLPVRPAPGARGRPPGRLRPVVPHRPSHRALVTHLGGLAVALTVAWAPAMLLSALTGELSTRLARGARL